METSQTIVLVISALISFGIGRTIMHFRKKKKAADKASAERRIAQALRDTPPGPESKNKSKRKRQARLQQR